MLWTPDTPSDVFVTLDGIVLNWNCGDPIPLHPDTAPEAIAADQRAAVAEVLALGVADPAVISDVVDLPASVVERRLAELRLLRAAS